MHAGTVSAKDIQAHPTNSLRPKDYLPFAWEQHVGWCILNFKNSTSLVLLRYGNDNKFDALFRSKGVSMRWTFSASCFKQAQNKALKRMHRLLKPVLEEIELQR